MAQKSWRAIKELCYWPPGMTRRRKVNAKCLEGEAVSRQAEVKVMALLSTGGQEVSKGAMAGGTYKCAHESWSVMNGSPWQLVGMEAWIDSRCCLSRPPSGGTARDNLTNTVDRWRTQQSTGAGAPLEFKQSQFFSSLRVQSRTVNGRLSKYCVFLHSTSTELI